MLFNSKFKDYKTINGCFTETLNTYDQHLFCRQPYSIRLLRLDL